MFVQSKLEPPNIKVSWEDDEYGDLYGQARALRPRRSPLVFARFHRISIVDTAAKWLGSAASIV